MRTPLVTLTLAGYAGPARILAFAQMGLARPELARTDGLRFWKLVGSGRGAGFSLRPDFSRYGLFAVWETPDHADRFFAESPMSAWFQRHASETWTVRMLPVSSHGTWSGVEPFGSFCERPAPEEPVAVLTRASIGLRRLGAFWRAVPATSRELQSAAGRVVSVGIGEAPFVRQATFSVWKNERVMRAFAYESPVHREVIRRTRDEAWYSEELFARFLPIGSSGTWDGHDPLARLW